MRSWPCLVVVALFAAASTSCSKDPEEAKREFIASGDRYVQAANYAEAVIQYRNAVQLDGSSGEARYKLANAYADSGDLRNALREFVRAADLMPTHIEAQLRAGYGLLGAGQYPEAKARAFAVLGKEPANVRGLILMGNAMAGMKDLDGAISTLGQAIDAGPQQTLTYSNLGAFEMAKGNRDAAADAFKRAVEIDPTSESAHLALANFSWATGDRAAAERELKLVLQSNPKSVTANRALAVLYGITNRQNESEQYLKAYANLVEEVGPTIVLADFYLLRNRVPEALAVLKPLLDTKTGFAPAKLRAAAVDFAARRREQAYNALDEIFAREPGNEEALLSKGRFLLAERKPAEALVQANLAIKGNPKSSGAQYLKGQALKDSGALGDALDAFREALRLSPNATIAMAQMAELSLARGDAALAAEYATQVLRRQPGAGPVHLILARALIQLGHLGRAEQEVAGLVAGSPRSANVHALHGDFQWAKKNLTGARQAYERALSLKSGSIEALAGLVRIDLTEKKVDAARARIEAQLARTPDDQPLLSLAGSAYMDMGDVPKAEASFRRILQLNPASMSAYGALASIYVKQNRLDEARAEYEQAARRQPKSAPAALTMAGTILGLQGKDAEARKRFEEALSIDPQMPIAANNLAWDYADHDENLDVALKLAQTAKSKLPDSFYASDTLGWVYYKKGLSRLAVESFEEAAKQAPTNASIRYRLGLAHIKNGDKTKGRRSLEQALQIDGAFREAADARRALASLKS